MKAIRVVIRDWIKKRERKESAACVVTVKSVDCESESVTLLIPIIAVERQSHGTTIVILVSRGCNM